jgi:cobalamin synthase
LDIFWQYETFSEFLSKRGLEEGTADAGDVLGAVTSELGMPTILKDVKVGMENWLH